VRYDRPALKKTGKFDPGMSKLDPAVRCGSAVWKLQKSDVYNPIVQFKPFDMMGIYYVGPITPAGETTGYKYIIIAIDQRITMEFLFDHFVPIVGWPKVVYTDNRT
jgi:hypothetical protein